MKQYFVYIWLDRTRKMFYIGSHFGTLDDNYSTSSHWLSGEIRFRSNEFKRRIVKICSSKEEMLSLEYSLISKIPNHLKGVRYYNVKVGRPSGTDPWNKGKTGIYSNDTLKKMSLAKVGREAHNKGKPNPNAAENARKGSSKLASIATGRKRLYYEDGSWTWHHPDGCFGNKEQPKNPQLN